MIKRLIHVLLLAIPGLTALAGEVETNVRIEAPALYAVGTTLLVKYDNYAGLPVSSSVMKINGSKAFIEFGIDETKKLVHSPNLVSVIEFTYTTKDFALNTSLPAAQTLTINYYPTGEYKPQAFLYLSNVSYISISAYTIKTYYINSSNTMILIANPADLYVEGDIDVDETPVFDFATSLPLTSVIGYNVINNGVDRELQMYWDYVPGAEEYELEWVYVDDYDPLLYSNHKATAALNYDFAHDATRIVTSNQFYHVPLIYEKGWIIFRVRGVGRSVANNNIRLEGTWSNSGYETGVLSAFISAFPSQRYNITIAHETDKLNYSMTRSFTENGRSGTGVNYEDGLMKTRESVARLNTEDKTIAGSTLYDWQGRPAIKTLPAPLAENFISYKSKLNMTASNTPYDKNTFDNLGLFTNTCVPTGMPMSAANSTGAARYYSISNTDKDAQQAMVPESQGFPFTQTEYYPDQTGRIKRQTIPGGTHILGSNKEQTFYYSQPTQEELVRLFGTEVGRYDEYQKKIEKDANGQVAVAYIDDQGKTVATALYGDNPANLLPIPDETTPQQSYTTTLTNNLNDAPNYVLAMANNFYANQGEVVKIGYSVEVSQYKDDCLPNMCLDCIYELSISITDDCGNEILPDNQPVTAILGRYNPNNTPSFSTTCLQDLDKLDFSLTPNPYPFTAATAGMYHITKTLRLSTLPLDYYAQAFVENNTCIETLTDFQEHALSDIDFEGCNMDCAACSTAVNNLVAGLPPGSLSSQQVTDLLEKCNESCDLKNICSSRKKLLLMNFKPGGYFAKYNGSGTPGFNSTDPLSVYNPTNTLKTTLNIVGGPTAPWYALPPVSYGSYTVVNPVNGANVTPDQLAVPDFIGTYNNDYGEPWVKWHPEYCKLQFYCDGLISAITTYSNALNSIASFDEACKQGYLFPYASASSLPDAPNASSCPCAPGSNKYIPLSGFSGSSAFSTAQINSALSALTSSFSAATYTSSAGNITANLYQYGISIGSNLNTNSIVSGAISTAFGNDNCYRDRQWEFYKRFYLNLISNTIENLKTTYIASWSSSNGGCLTNFSSLPGYVKIFPDGSSAGMSIINNFGGGASTSSGSVAAASSTVASQCASFCSSYVNNWLADLAPCGISDSNWPSVKTALQAVCAAGCDAQDPFGASNCVPGVTLSISGSTVTVFTFQDVLSAYGYTPTASCNAYLINAPKPKGYSYSGAAATTPTLDACGCNAILVAHSNYTLGVYNYTNGITGTTVNPCITTEASFVAQQLGAPLNNLSSYVCACQQAYNGASYTFSMVSADLLGTLALPENLACSHCIPCGQLQSSYRTLSRVIPGFTVTPTSLAGLDPTVLSNFFNGALNMNNTYSQWMTFIDDCNNNNTQGSYNGTSGISTLTTPEASAFSTLFSSLAANNFLNPNTTSTYYVLTTGNASAFFNSALWPTGLTGLPTASVLVSMNTASTAITVAVTSTTAPSYSCSFVLQIPSTVSGTFPDFSTVSSVNFSGVKGRCDKVNSYEKGYVLNFSFANNTSGAVTSYTLNGTNSCYNTLDMPHIANPQNALCQPYLCRNSLNMEVPKSDCIGTLINNALNTAQTQYNVYIKKQVGQFLAGYKNYCYGHVTETAQRLYSIKEYNYTLYYYDRAGNLVHTVPPASVQPITNPVTITNAINFVNNTGGSAVYPAHSLNNITGIDSYVTHFQYNSFDLPLVMVTPDGGETTYLYDNAGRLAASQNAKQTPLTKYSYTLYDELGRIKEVGSIKASTDILTADIVKNPTLWASFVSAHAKSEVTQTFYDVYLNTIINSQFTGGQQNLRNRISGVTFEKAFDSNKDTYDYGTFYSYDDHGNAKEIVQHNPVISFASNNQYKHIEYEYELISSNVTKTIYQRGKADQFYHRYYYDADNRVHEVQTSNDDISYQRDAKQFYYQHGYLARTELGEKQVQGMDFAYTIQGWIKGANSTLLQEGYDIGKDVNTTNAYMTAFPGIHQDFAKDAASYNLNYYGNDYSPIKTANSNFIADISSLNPGTSSGFKLSDDGPDLYNGNIASMVTSIYDINTLSPDKGLVKPQITAYRYDQLQRLRNLKAYSSLRINYPSGAQYSEAIKLSTNQWLPPVAQNYAGIYQMRIDYDKLGNIMHLNRDGDATFSGSWLPKAMDQLTYNYMTTAGIYVPSLARTINVNNRLSKVADLVNASNYSTDIDNQTNAANYTYDERGSLIQNLSEEIQSIDWTEGNKIKSITRTSGSTKPALQFEYDGFGRRISKKVISAGGSPIITTHYVLDTEGKTLAVYTENVASNILTCTEQMIYSTKRTGTKKVKIDMTVTPPPTTTVEIFYGRKKYEINNHLDNVITTVSDRKCAIDGKYNYAGNAGGNFVYDGYTFTPVAAGTGYYSQVTAPNGLVDYYVPEITSTTDYYAFGTNMPGRTFALSGGDYRYRHNGQEKDVEIFEEALSAEFWEYDTRLGRRWEQDPIMEASLSPYSVFRDSPIQYADPSGLSSGDPVGKIRAFLTRTYHNLQSISHTKFGTKFKIDKLVHTIQTIQKAAKWVGHLFAEPEKPERKEAPEPEEEEKEEESSFKAEDHEADERNSPEAQDIERYIMPSGLAFYNTYGAANPKYNATGIKKNKDNVFGFTNPTEFTRVKNRINLGQTITSGTEFPLSLLRMSYPLDRKPLMISATEGSGSGITGNPAADTRQNSILLRVKPYRAYVSTRSNAPVLSADSPGPPWWLRWFYGPPIPD